MRLGNRLQRLSARDRDVVLSRRSPRGPTSRRFINPAATVLTGLLLAWPTFAGAVYVLHRLTTLELCARAARSTVLLISVCPAAVFVSRPLHREPVPVAVGHGLLRSAHRAMGACELDGRRRRRNPQRRRSPVAAARLPVLPAPSRLRVLRRPDQPPPPAPQA